MIHVQEVLSFCAEQALEKANMKSDNIEDKLERALKDPTTSKDHKEKLVKAQENAASIETNALELLCKQGKRFFALYKTFLGDNACARWKRIVTTQIGVPPWTDLFWNSTCVNL